MPKLWRSGIKRHLLIRSNVLPSTKQHLILFLIRLGLGLSLMLGLIRVIRVIMDLHR